MSVKPFLCGAIVGATAAAAIALLFPRSAVAALPPIPASSPPAASKRSAPTPVLVPSGDFDSAAVWVPRPDTADHQYRVMELLRSAIPRVRRRLFVFVTSPSTSGGDAGMDGAATRRSLLAMYEDAFAVMLELQRLMIDVIVLPATGAMGLVECAKVLLLPEVEAVFSEGGKDELVAMGAASNSRRELNIDIIKVVQSAPPSSGEGEALFEGPSYDPTSMQFAQVVLGGTFDHLHVGHRKLLTVAAMACTDTMTIGVTSDEMVAKKSDAGSIQPYPARVQAVLDFLSIIKPSIRVNIVKLSEPFGPTVTDPALQAIVVSSETKRGAVEINRVREGKGFPKLFTIVTQRENNAVVSSTFLRKIFQSPHSSL